VRATVWCCIVAVLIVVFGPAFLEALSPCEALRESVRKRDWLATILPDSIVDMDIAARYGTLSPGRCLDLLLSQKPITLSTSAQPAQPATLPSSTPPAPPQQTSPDLRSNGQEALNRATKQAQAAINECKAERLNEELSTAAASVQCSNPRVIQAFDAVHYRYMDLIRALAEKRLEVAQKIDRKELTEDQAQVEYAKLFMELLAAERQRDASARR
jgi:hypothetical protein